MKKSLQIVNALLIVILMSSIMIFFGFVPGSAIKETSVSPSTPAISMGRDISLLRNANANGTTTMKMDPSTVTTSVDTEFSVNITIGSVTDMSGWEISIFWDNAYINCDSATIYTPAAWSGHTCNVDSSIQNSWNSTAGNYGYAQASQYGIDTINGSLTVATLTFHQKVNASGTKYMTFDDSFTLLVDRYDSLIPVTTTSCTITMTTSTTILSDGFELGNGFAAWDGTTISIGRDTSANGTRTNYPVANETEAVPSTVDTINSTYAIDTYPDVFDGPYFDVTPSAVHLGAEGQTFTVTIALHNVTVENVPAGIGGVEVHMTWNTSLVQPVNYTDYLGVQGTGALTGQIWCALKGFYNSTLGSDPSNPLSCNEPASDLAQTTEFDVAAAGNSPWWSVNSPGIVAVIAFNVTSPPSSPSTTCSLHLNFTDLGDAYASEVPHNVMLKVSTDWAEPDDTSVTVTAFPFHGDSFVLSYRFLFNGTTTDWINVAMTKNGNTYSAIIDNGPIASAHYATVQWKVTGYDNGHSFQSDTCEFDYSCDYIGE